MEEIEEILRDTTPERLRFTHTDVLGFIKDNSEAIVKALTEKGKEQVDHPSHYNQFPIEVIDMMRSIWGEEKTATFCEMNAFKYRMRLGHKGDFKQVLKKEYWYLEKAKAIRHYFKTNDEDFLT